MRGCTIFLLMATMAAAAASAQTPPAPPENTPTISKDALKNRSGLPVPRFGSVRSGRAFVRAGPGKEYPVQWVLVRSGLPVEILYEWNIWRKIRTSDGSEGWVDRAMLSTERTLQIVGETRTLYARPDLSAPPVWRAEPGVTARITMCERRWCRIEAEGRSGYLLREQAFGTYPDEPVG